MSALKVLIRNITTEKSSSAQSRGSYTFEVSRSATKIDVKNAIKEVYGVDVKKVTMMVSPKKERIVKRGRIWAKRAVKKKAIVSLKNGKTIDPSKVGKAKEAKTTTKVTKVTKSTKPKTVKA